MNKRDIKKSVGKDLYNIFFDNSIHPDKTNVIFDTPLPIYNIQKIAQRIIQYFFFFYFTSVPQLFIRSFVGVAGVHMRARVQR